MFGDDVSLDSPLKSAATCFKDTNMYHHKISQFYRAESLSEDSSHNFTSHSNRTESSLTVSSPRIVPEKEITQLIKNVIKQPRDFSITNRELYMLLFSVLESVSSLNGSRGTSKISSTIHLLQSMTMLLEDMVGGWLQLDKRDSLMEGRMNDGKNRRNRKSSPVKQACLEEKRGGGEQDDYEEKEEKEIEGAYNGSLHLARITLRLWVSLSLQILHSDLQEQHLQDIQPMLFSPLETLSKTCYNLQEVGIFKGNDTLDHEFTLIILEALFSSLYIINLYPKVPVCQVSNFYEVLRDTLTDGCQEWFAYLCSKLHGVSESTTVSVHRSSHSGDSEKKEDDEGNTNVKQITSNWIPVLNYSHSLLALILVQLLSTSSNIKLCQQASKMALVSTATNYKSISSNFPFKSPVTYSLEVATGFDKLTFRLSRMAEFLLSMFKEVPYVQFLSLKLLSETTKDVIGVLGNFLSSISDPNVSSKPEILDSYLDLLEEIWFRLSPEYSVSAPWWKKLSNYSHLLMGSDYQLTCQAIHHIQCLFGHESSSLKSQLTKRVVVPFHTHLMSQVKAKCFRTKTSMTSKRERLVKDAQTSPHVTQMVKMGDETNLEENEKEILTLFLKLLAKVVSHPRSLAAFASSGTNLYSLFLLFPLEGFRLAGLRVLEECLFTIHRFGSSKCSSPISTASSPIGSGGQLGPSPVETSKPDETGIQKTLLHILISIAYSVQVDKIPEQCLSIAEGRASLPNYGLAESDQVTKLIMSTFEQQTINQLLVHEFIRHIRIMTDVWKLLAQLAVHDDSAAEILKKNYIWDVIKVFGQSIGNVLSRLHQRESCNMEDLSELEVFIQPLRECGVSLLSHFLVLAHYLCWHKRDQRVGCQKYKNHCLITNTSETCL